MHKKSLIYSIAFFTGIAGVLHATIIAFNHVEPLPLETLFFLLGGITQIVLSIFLFRVARIKYVALIVIVNGGMATVWILTRLFRAPFMNSPEEVGARGLFVLTMELLAIGGALFYKWFNRHRIKEVHGYAFSYVVGMVLVGSLFSGFGVYGTGLAGEIIMPDRSVSHSHADSEDDHGDNSHPHTDTNNEHSEEEQTDTHLEIKQDHEAKKMIEPHEKNEVKIESDHHEDDGHHD